MTLLLDLIRDHLIAQGIAGNLTGWPIYEGIFPDDQDQMIGVFETGGEPADTMLRENRRVTFQSRVRAARLDYATARDKWDEIFNALQDANQIPGSPLLLGGIIFIQAMQVAPLHFNDNKGRPNMTCNWRVMRLAA